MTEVRSATFAELDTDLLYEILRLRVDVFVVEQGCAYPELDGADHDAVHHWIADADGLGAYLRVIDEGHQRRIGRVVTHPRARSRGWARRLILHALDRSAAPWLLSAQAHLRDWYASLGFVAVGEEYVEDGIPHVDMVRQD